MPSSDWLILHLTRRRLRRYANFSMADPATSAVRADTVRSHVCYLKASHLVVHEMFREIAGDDGER